MEIFSTFKEVHLIDKGWSVDKKYLAVDDKGDKFLIRITPIERLEVKEKEFNHMCDVFEAGVPINKPLSINVDEDNVYTLFEWIDGDDASDTIKTLTPETQYKLGVDSGQYLKKISEVNCPKRDWNEHYSKKIEVKIKNFVECDVNVRNSMKVIEFIRNNQYLIKERQTSFLHGDYHIGNFIINNDSLFILDFNRYDYGDVIDEFNRIHFSAKASEAFACGMIDGFTEFNPSDEFFTLVALYSAVNLLASIPWGKAYSPKELEVMIGFYDYIMDYYNDFDQVVPTWYNEKNRYL
jgi:aminoglycoside phosphotransferase (APT) family kinase protein